MIDFWQRCGMNNVEWIKIIYMAVQLFHSSDFSGQTHLQIQWIIPDAYDFIAPDSLPAASISLVTPDGKQTLREYILIPRQNLYQKKISADDQNIRITQELISVTPFAIAFQAFARLTDTNLIRIAKKFDSRFYKLIQTDSNQRVIREDTGFTIPNGLRVIRMREYAHYIDLEVAQPGSKAVQRAIPDILPKNKMIRLSMIPDYGPIHTQWIEQPNNYYDSCVSLTEKAVINIIGSTFSDAVNNGNHAGKNILYSMCQDRIERANIPVSCNSTSVTSHWIKILRQLLLFENDFDPYEDIQRIYPGYEPKLSPDSILDYMGELSVDISQLPESSLDRLPELVKLYEQFRKKAKNNPGQWNDGNMILGANDKEYAPTREELLLNETGNRIKKIIESEKREEIARIMKINKIKNKTIRYKHFTFRHTDVMGSGRFTYVDRIVEMKFELKKKE